MAGNPTGTNVNAFEDIDAKIFKVELYVFEGVEILQIQGSEVYVFEDFIAFKFDIFEDVTSELNRNQFLTFCHNDRFEVFDFQTLAK